MDLFQIPDDYKPQNPLKDSQAQDITNYLKGHPLFLNQIPEDISSNEHLVALQALVADQDPETTAQNLNKQANARILQGPNNPYYMKDAYKKYTEAIHLNPKSQALKAKLHCNRASINLKYKNYGKVIQDCKISINCDPKYIKAYYRMGKAYIFLKKYDECIQLLGTQTQPELTAIKQQAIILKKQEQESKMKLQQKSHSFSTKIEEYFANKKWKFSKTKQNLPQGVEIQFIDEQISIPVIVVYPEFNQFDLIAKTSQNQQIAQCLHQLFQNPLPWDAKGDYKQNTIQIYGELQEAVLLKLPKQATIGQIASRVPVRGAIEIIILTNNQFAPFYKNQYKIY